MLKIINIEIKHKQVCLGVKPRQRQDGNEYDTITIFLNTGKTLKIGIESQSKYYGGTPALGVTSSLMNITSSDKSGVLYSGLAHQHDIRAENDFKFVNITHYEYVTENAITPIEPPAKNDITYSAEEAGLVFYYYDKKVGVVWMENHGNENFYPLNIFYINENGEIRSESF